VFFGYQYLFYKEKKEWGSASRLYSDVYDLNALVGKIGIVNFSLEDTSKYILRSNLVTEKDKLFLESWAQSRQRQKSDKKYFGSQKAKNIIIIQVESLEGAVINQKINGQEITPNLNKLAGEGLYFDNYYAPVGPGNTADTEFSTMNSLYPLPNDVAFVNYAKNKYNALPKLLKKNGFETVCFHGDVPTFWNRSNIYPGLGYDEMFGLSDFTATRKVGKGPSSLGDEDLFSQTLPKLKELKQPFFSTVITMSSHTPFILPQDLQTLQFPGDSALNATQKNYLQSIHYTDKAIGQFIEGLKKEGIYKNSLIFVLGDHSSFTNISSVLEQNGIISPQMEKNRVPMMLLNANLQGTNNIPASHLDIYPTITNLLGIEAPKTVLGQDLLNTKTPVASRFGLVSGGIASVLTKDLFYESSPDGAFQNGECRSMPDKKLLPIQNCKTIYDEQFNTIKASNIVIRGDLLDLLAK
jgi:phosphoglycerol transferase MdoB-like AlkP superfamily enzyme